MKVSFQFAVAFALLAVSTSASAADLAILRNGNSIRHERRQVVGPITRLYLSNSSNGYIEIPTDQIERFEFDTAPPPVLAKPAVTPSPIPQQVPSVGMKMQSAPAPALDRASLNKVVDGAGERHQIDPDFINSMIRAESGFNNRAVSKKGAQGLMQLMPQTASQLGVANSFDPNANVEGGTKYLRELLEKYNFDVAKALAAYNAGPKRVEQYRGVPPYYETRAYIARIIRDFNRQKLAENPALAGTTTAHPSQTAHSSQTTRPQRRLNRASTAPASSVQQNPQTASR